MADRVFAGILLLVTLVYGTIAFTVIRAPFQYDPLGPESWPQILSVLAAPSFLFIIARPDVDRFDNDRHTLVRVGASAVLMVAYAWLFEPAGFIIATLLFCTAMARMLGTRLLPAFVFGLVTATLGYLVGTVLLDLNLPEGILPSFT